MRPARRLSAAWRAEHAAVADAKEDAASERRAAEREAKDIERATRS